MVNDIEARKNKISILGKIAFSSEQECRRTEQQLQEFIAQMDRMQKMIANVLNNDNEGYSNLKQIVKENVKAVLSNNKILLSASFAEVIQTLKTDPQTVKLIYNIGAATNGGQHKDDDNNIIKYLEFNKDAILNLTEKNSEIAKPVLFLINMCLCLSSVSYIILKYKHCIMLYIYYL